MEKDYDLLVLLLLGLLVILLLLSFIVVDIRFIIWYLLPPKTYSQNPKP